VADVVVRAPHLIDVGALLHGMRAADLAEMHALGQYDAQRLVERSLTNSVLSWAALVDGELAMLFGVAPARGALLGDTGVPWALGTDLVARHGRSLMRRADSYIAQMLRVYPRLFNFVHAENTVAITWLERMKFEVGPAAPHGPHRALFRRFEMHADGPDASRRV
jgi:hypothetical protein